MGRRPLCAAFEQRGPIDVARALELAFDVAELARRVEREVEAPLEWRLDGGGGVAGYDVETRVRARATPGAATHVSLDPEREVLLGRPGFSFYEVPAGTLRAPLRDVTGTLTLAVAPGSTLRWAALFEELYFGPDHTDGDRRPVLSVEAGERCARVYSPRRWELARGRGERRGGHDREPGARSFRGVTRAAAGCGSRPSAAR